MAPIVRVACECVAGDAYRGLSVQEIEGRENVERFYRQPDWQRYRGAVLMSVPAVPRGQISKALNRGMGVYLHGLSGRGKTWAGVAILNFLADQGRTIGARLAPDLVGDLYEAMRQVNAKSDERQAGWLTPERVIDGACDVDALLLDDVGKEPLTRFVVGHFFRLFDQRSRTHTPNRLTFFTSNHSLDELAAIYERNPETAQFAEPICSRIVGMAIQIELTGRDRRLT